MVDASDGDDGGQVGVIDAEVAGEFVFVVEEGAGGGGLFVEMVNGAIEEAEEFGGGVIGFGDEVEELGEVGGETNAWVIATEIFARVGEDGFAQGVEFRFGAAGEADFAVVEKVEQAGEAALRAESAFGDGLYFAVGEGEPGDDEAGVAEAGFADEDGASGFQSRGNEMNDSGGWASGIFILCEKPIAGRGRVS